MKCKGYDPAFSCTRCNGYVRTIETRPVAREKNVIRRIRVCRECGHRMYTQERIVREADDEDCERISI